MCQALGNAKVNKMRFLLSLVVETDTPREENTVNTGSEGCRCIGHRQESRVGNNMAFGSKVLSFEAWLRLLLPVWLRTSYLTSPCLSLFICEVGILSYLYHMKTSTLKTVCHSTYLDLIYLPIV